MTLYQPASHRWQQRYDQIKRNVRVRDRPHEEITESYAQRKAAQSRIWGKKNIKGRSKRKKCMQTEKCSLCFGRSRASKGKKREEVLGVLTVQKYKPNFWFGRNFQEDAQLEYRRKINGRNSSSLPVGLLVSWASVSERCSGQNVG
jgi:hypothetical protein